MSYDIELGQGDSEDVGIILKENGVAKDLTDTTIVFSMVNEAGISYDITCSGGADINGEDVAFSAGGVTLPISSTHTATPTTFFGKFIITYLGVQSTCPRGNNYISVKIWEKP